jgi:hypothetical protein
MFEKLVPLIFIIIALQFIMKIMNKRNRNNQTIMRDFDYKRKIDQLMKTGNMNGSIYKERLLTDDLRFKMQKSNLISGIPDSMGELKSGINLIIDAVTHSIKEKLGTNNSIESKYSAPEKMFDEIVEVINRHKTEEKDVPADPPANDQQ